MKNLLLLPLALLVVISCRQPKLTPGYFVFYNATIIDGTGAEPVPDGVLIIRDGKVVYAGPHNDTTRTIVGPIYRDLGGKFVIPGLINSHGHVGEIKGIEGGHYSRENVIDNLAIYARYGITTVVSLGGDKKEAVPLRAVNDTTSKQRARLYIAGDVINTPAVADSNHAMGVDWMKIRVDDNLGTSAKMSEETYKAIIDRSHELGYKIATHMYYLDDAKKLLQAGSDMMAHSVRDKPVDEEFMALMKEKKVCYCPTLTRELSTFVYETRPEFFNDPFFLKEFDTLRIQNNKSGQIYKQQLPVAMSNLKTVSDQGIPIAFGTDTGVPGRFFGYFEHVEMQMMADAGMSPMQIIVSATKGAADCMGLRNIGTLEKGKWADFIILTADPLADIKNTRTIESVWIGGELLGGR